MLLSLESKLEIRGQQRTGVLGVETSNSDVTARELAIGLDGSRGVNVLSVRGVGSLVVASVLVVVSVLVLLGPSVDVMVVMLVTVLVGRGRAADETAR